MENEKKLKNEELLGIIEESKQEISSENCLDKIRDDNLSSIKSKIVKGEIDFKEGSKQMAHSMVTADSFDETKEENKGFLRETKKIKQEELKNDFISDKVKSQADIFEAKSEKAEAFYKNWRPILEFDFSNITKHKKEKEEVSNNERAWGIPFMALILVLAIPLYCAIAMILYALNGINAIFTCIASFGKVASIVCLVIVLIGFLIIGSYVGIVTIEEVFNVNILP